MVPPAPWIVSADLDMREVAPEGVLFTTATPWVFVTAAWTIVGAALLPTTVVLTGFARIVVFAGTVVVLGLLTVGDLAVSGSDKLIATALLRSINWKGKHQKIC